MGTKVDAKMYLPGRGYYTIRDLDENIGNDSLSLHHETGALNRGQQYYDMFLTSEGNSGYDRQQMRQTILNHELTFKHQLHELHRLYSRQRDLMNEIQREQLYEDRDFVYSRPGTDGVRSENCKYFESRCQKLQKRLFDLEVPVDKYVNYEDVNFGYNGHLSSSNARLWNHGLTDLNEPFQAGEAIPSSSKWESRKQISFLYSKNSNTQFLSKEFSQNGKNGGFCLNDLLTENESPVHGVYYHPTKAHEFFKLPSLLDQATTEPQKRKTIFGVDISSRSNNQPEKLRGGLHWLRKPIISSEETFKRHSQVLVDTPLQMKPSLSVNGSRPHIDLNMCLNEEDEIDLETTFILDNEETSSYKEIDLEEDNVKNAAEAIVVISSYCVPEIPSSDDSLYWFADTISSCEDDLEKDKTVIPQIDYFEFMTLKLTETKLEEEHYHYHKPVAIDTPKDEEVLHKRPRRGQARRGKQQRKDFKRDILPGLASLTRHEVTEDLQTIEDIIKITGGTWESSYTKRNAARAARGKRRVQIVSSVSPSTIQKINRNDLGLEEKSLTGWGKRTRRPPRNRYPIYVSQVKLVL